MVLRLLAGLLAAAVELFLISDRTEDGGLELAVVVIQDCWAGRGQSGIWSMLIVRATTNFYYFF